MRTKNVMRTASFGQSNEMVKKVMLGGLLVSSVWFSSTASAFNNHHISKKWQVNDDNIAVATSSDYQVIAKVLTVDNISQLYFYPKTQCQSESSENEILKVKVNSHPINFKKVCLDNEWVYFASSAHEQQYLKKQFEKKTTVTVGPKVFTAINFEDAVLKQKYAEL